MFLVVLTFVNFFSPVKNMEIRKMSTGKARPLTYQLSSVVHGFPSRVPTKMPSESQSLPFLFMISYCNTPQYVRWLACELTRRVVESMHVAVSQNSSHLPSVFRKLGVALPRFPQCSIDYPGFTVDFPLAVLVLLKCATVVLWFFLD